MRVLFIGTGEIGVPVLRWLAEAREHELVGIVTQPDKPVGRAQRIEAPPIKAAIVASKLPLLQPKRIKDAVEEIRALKDNRLDDANEEVIQRRLALYETESKPVLGYYGPERITCIDATQPPAKVLLHILESVNDGVNGAHEPEAV